MLKVMGVTFLTLKCFLLSQLNEELNTTMPFDGWLVILAKPWAWIGADCLFVQPMTDLWQSLFLPFELVTLVMQKLHTSPSSLKKKKNAQMAEQIFTSFGEILHAFLLCNTSIPEHL